MTDITDEDRRYAREWATAMEKRQTVHPPVRAAARVILATMDAPAPTIAEELARIAENSAVWTIKNVCDELNSAADRAAQMERDLAEARAEVERLTAERDREKAISKGRMEAHQKLAEHHAESVTVATVAPEENVAADQQANTQGILAGSPPDPADVKPGEAWIVECRGERRTAVKDRGDDVPWNTVAADGLFFSEENENVTLLHRLVPAPRVITNADELDRAKRDTIIRDARGVVCSRDCMGHAWTTFTSLADQRPHIALPATVLWEPEA